MAAAAAAWLSKGAASGVNPAAAYRTARLFAEVWGALLLAVRMGNIGLAYMAPVG